MRQEYMRQDQSTTLDKLIDNEVATSIKKTASVKIDKMSLLEARKARRSGAFIKVASDLYKNVETNDMWKLSEDKSHVVRVFDEKNGVAQA